MAIAGYHLLRRDARLEIRLRGRLPIWRLLQVRPLYRFASAPVASNSPSLLPADQKLSVMSVLNPVTVRLSLLSCLRCPIFPIALPLCAPMAMFLI